MQNDASRTRPGAKCSVGRMLADITSKKDRDWLSKVMDGIDEDRHSPAEATNVALQLGYEMTPPIVRRHRRRLTGGEKCWCPA